MTHGKTYNKSPRRINHKATKSKTNTGTTALERSVEQTTGVFKALLQLVFKFWYSLLLNLDACCVCIKFEFTQSPRTHEAMLFFFFFFFFFFFVTGSKFSKSKYAPKRGIRNEIRNGSYFIADLTFCV